MPFWKRTILKNLTLKRLLLPGLCLSAMLAPAWGAECADQGASLIDLRVVSDRGDGFDRTHRIRLDVDGCLVLQRPPAHRSPGEYRARLEPAQLARLAARAADPALRAIDPEQALRQAQSSSAERAAERGLLQRTYISHPTGYVLRLGEGDAQRELKIESVFQHADLHPESAELAALAAIIAEVMKLDQLPESSAGAQP